MEGVRVFTPGESNDTNVVDLAHLRTQELISFLSSSFRMTDFEKVGMILRSREDSMTAEFQKNLSESKIAMEARCESLERVLADLRSRHLELIDKNQKEDGGLRIGIVELEEKLRKEREGFASLEAKFGELEFRKFVASGELEKYKQVCFRLEQQVARLDEDCRVLRVKEQRAQERIKGLLEELQRKDEELKNFIELKEENRVLDSAKRRLQDEVDVWKRKYGKLEAEALRLIEENPDLINRSRSIDKKEGKKQSCESKDRMEYTVKHEVGSDREDGPSVLEGVIEIGDSENE